MTNNEEIKDQEIKESQTSEVQQVNESKEQNSSVNKNKEPKLDKTKQSKDKKAKKPKDKKVNSVSKTFSELKKVSWPTFGQVVKQTSIVIVVTLAFLLVIFGLDRLCSLLVGLIVS